MEKDWNPSLICVEDFAKDYSESDIVGVSQIDGAVMIDLKDGSEIYVDSPDPQSFFKEFNAIK